MEFGVLGTIEVVGGGRRFSLGGPKQRCVLALLVANAGGPVSVGSLIDGVYGENAPERAHRSIHTFVSNLRAELGDMIERRGDGYVLTVDRAEIDALRFEDLVAEAGAAEDPARAGELLRDALGLWRGHPYADVDANTVLGGEVTRLNEIRMAAIEARVDADLACGRDSELLGELDSLAAEYPLHERFRAQQMLALYRAGRQGEALRAYSRTRLYLVEEMGLDPSPELQQLEARILDQDPSLLLPSRPKVTHAAVVVADLGDARQLTLLPPAVRFKVLSEQAAVITNAVTSQGGRVFANSGAATYAWFRTAAAAAHAAVEMRRRAPAESPQMRLAVAVGDLEVAADDVSGPPIRRAASLVASAHPGQILLAEDAQEEVAASGAAGLLVRSLGSHDIEGLAEHELVYQLGVDGSSEVFPPLLTGERPASLPYHERGLPGYELREELRSSAFGLVHRGYQPSLGREVAIKIIHSEYANDPSFIRRFEIEAQMVTRLEHPHIAPLLDYWRSPEGAFLVMRWMGGGTLADRIQESPLSVEQTDVILTAIGAALDYAHRNGIAHGNLNPASVVFDGEGNPYLTDFNVAPLDTVGNLIGGDVHDLAQLVERCVEDDESVEAFLIEATSAPGYATVQDLLDGWRDVVGERTAVTVATFTATRNPYKGLRAFSELDADDFFGRDHETARLVDTVRERRLVAVVGPSGVGKSSVVRAGLLPQLRAGVIDGSGEWLVVDMIPGPYPFEELASCLLRVAAEAPADLEAELRHNERGLVKAIARYLPRNAELVLVIDQFEELFTLVADDAEREAFLEILRSAVLDERANVRVIVTMRADFFDRPLRFGDFGDLLSDATVPLPAASEENLRQMIEMPAARVGVVFEPGLADRIAADVKDQPGALPLLEFSLTELFETRTADVLTIADYERTGGVLGALGRRAESIYDGLGDEVEGAVRELLLRMVRVAEAGRDTRRRVRRTELAHLGIGSGAVDRVLKAFGDERLLTFDRDPITRGPTVEVAHEAILSEWERLAGWIGEYREDLLMRGRLAVAVADWEASGRSEEFLLSGGRLSQHESWTESTELAVSPGEAGLLAASRQAEDQQRAARRRSRRFAMSALSAAALVSLLLGLVAWVQRIDAEHARLEAYVREVSAQADAQLADDPELSLLLAIESLRTARDAGINTLAPSKVVRKALAANRVVSRWEGGTFVDVSSDGSLFVTGSPDGGALVRDIKTGEVVASLLREDGAAIGAEFSPDGEHIAVYYEATETPVWLWDRAGDSHVELQGPDTSDRGGTDYFSFDDSGSLLTAQFSETVLVWSTADGSLARTIQAQGGSQFIPGTTLLAVGDTDVGVFNTDHPEHRLILFDTETWEERSRSLPDVYPESMLASPDGSVIFVSHPAQGVSAVTLPGGVTQWVQDDISRPSGLAWLPDVGQLVVGSDGGQVYVLDATTGEVVRTLVGGHAGSVWGVSGVRGERVLTSGVDGTTVMWDSGPGPLGEVSRLATDTDGVRFAAFAPYPYRILVTDDEPRARVLNAESLAVIREIANPVVNHVGLETWAAARGRAIAETSLTRSLIRDAATDSVLYTAPEGMAVWNASDDLTRTVIAPGYDRSTDPVQVIDVASGGMICSIESIFLPVFSPDGSLLISMSDLGVDVYSADDCQILASLPFQTIRPMPDGRFASAVDLDGTVWQVDLVQLLAGSTVEEASTWHAFATDGTVFPNGHELSPDGAFVAVAGRTGGTVKIWSTREGTEIADLDSQLSTVPPYIFFHPDGPHVTLISESGALLTYTLDMDELLEIAGDRVARSLTDAECRTFLHVDACPVHS